MTDAKGSADARWTLVACILASSLSFIDGSVTNVALPAIGSALHASPAEQQWTINAYLLPLSALLLLGGAAGDHFGRRRLLIGGVALFTLASVACGVARDLPMLLAGRALQGLASAVVLPNSLALLNQAFRGEARGRAIGTWAAAGAIAAAVGPPLGGWLVDALGWPWIFFINLPVGGACLLLAWRFAKESADAERPLDWIGALLATLALGAETWGLTIWSSSRILSLEAILSIVAGLALGGIFVLHQRRLGEHAMMPLDLFASRAFAGLTLLTLLVYGALGGLLVLLPYALIRAGGYSALHAGFALLPFPLVVGLASRRMGSIAGRLGPRWPLTIGSALVSLGYLFAMRADPQSSYWTSIFPVMLIISAGMSSIAAPLTTAVLASVDDQYSGTASGFNSAIARAGGLLATAATGSVIGSSGVALVASFHVAAIAGAAMTAASSVIALMTLGGLRPRR